jgi:hypothetical protein
MDMMARYCPPFCLSSWGRNSAQHVFPLASTTQGNMTWPAANTAIFVPLSIPFYFPVAKVFWCNGSPANANCDVGLYTWDGARIFSLGSTAQGSASIAQFASLATPVLLAPGDYYMALACSGSSTNIFANTAVSAANGRIAGLRQMASALPLPATATFATYAGTGIPLFGVSKR